MANVIELIRKDHVEVKELFEKFKTSATQRTKKKIANKVCLELSKHAKAEEAVVYSLLEPETSEHAKKEHDDIEHIVLQIQEKRGDVSHLMVELEETVTHHIAEEENKALLEVGRSGEDLEKVGQEFQNLKEVL